MNGDNPHNLCEHYSTTEEETNEMGDGNIDENTDQTEQEIGVEDEQITGVTHSQDRRYPSRERRKPAHFSNYANWDEVPRDVTN